MVRIIYINLLYCIILSTKIRYLKTISIEWPSINRPPTLTCPNHTHTCIQCTSLHTHWKSFVHFVGSRDIGSTSQGTFPFSSLRACVCRNAGYLSPCVNRRRVIYLHAFYFGDGTFGFSMNLGPINRRLEYFSTFLCKANNQRLHNFVM